MKFGYLLSLAVLLSIGCKELDDFDPYYNHNVEGRVYYDMSDLMLDSGSHITGCISNTDLMQLYKPFLDSEANSLHFTIYLDGKFFGGGGGGSYVPYPQCMESLSNVQEGLHELVLDLYIGSDPYGSDVNENSLKNMLYASPNQKSFKEYIYIDHSPIGEIELIRAEKVDGVVYIEWTASKSENFAYYHIYETHFFDDYESNHFIYDRNSTLFIDTVGYSTPVYNLRVTNRKDDFIIDDIIIY